MAKVNLSKLCEIGRDKKVLAEFRRIVEGNGLDVKESLGMIGWSEVNSELQNCLTRTYNIVEAVICTIDAKKFVGYDIEMFNKRSREYGKTFDRIVLSGNSMEYVIVVGMPSSAYRVMLYEKINNGDLTNEIGRYKTLKEAFKRIGEE